jgi:hypothetical protein
MFLKGTHWEQGGVVGKQNALKKSLHPLAAQVFFLQQIRQVNLVTDSMWRE